MSRSAILVEHVTGTVLYEKNADEPIPPASITKLMTLHLVYQALEAGRLSRGHRVTVSPQAAFSALPPGSSGIRLRAGDRVSLQDLLRGAGIASGNDAAIALAEALAGSERAFVRWMNEEAKRLGLERTVFADCSGLSEESRTTAREVASFCRYYLSAHPQSLEEVHRQPAFQYQAEMAAGGMGALIRRGSTNLLIGRLEGVDGLKTGYIERSGFNFAATAAREGTRYIAVVLGCPAESYLDGILNRAVEAAILLLYGMYSYEYLVPDLPPPAPLRVFGGRLPRLPLTVRMDGGVVVDRAGSGLLRHELLLPAAVRAPVPKGAAVGRLRLLCGAHVLKETPVVAEAEVPPGPWYVRAVDAALSPFRRDVAAVGGPGTPARE
jgi:D-alanyl-D-alanine carboxypeptidase (penicillin-binding protein 5/6)